MNSYQAHTLAAMLLFWSLVSAAVAPSDFTWVGRAVAARNWKLWFTQFLNSCGLIKPSFDVSIFSNSSIIAVCMDGALIRDENSSGCVSLREINSFSRASSDDPWTASVVKRLLERPREHATFRQRSRGPAEFAKRRNNILERNVLCFLLVYAAFAQIEINGGETMSTYSK